MGREMLNPLGDYILSMTPSGNDVKKRFGDLSLRIKQAIITANRDSYPKINSMKLEFESKNTTQFNKDMAKLKKYVKELEKDFEWVIPSISKNALDGKKLTFSEKLREEHAMGMATPDVIRVRGGDVRMAEGDTLHVQAPTQPYYSPPQVRTSSGFSTTTATDGTSTTYTHSDND